MYRLIRTALGMCLILLLPVGTVRAQGWGWEGWGGWAQTPEGASQVEHFHRQLFADSAETMRLEIKRITGVDVREATAEVETKTGTVVHVFTTGTMVQVFLLAHGIAADTWNNTGTSDQI